ncbi:cadherin EGF LAG seven-pass G-type receptor fmi-1-like [Lineus longissimus]|uniref:cadherin EGF LAG seven-pass G-type receptor fmi-1-like n=1 Tax=Lineus longissimus TaxID=88925 RepID=UPI002B4C7E39
MMSYLPLTCVLLGYYTALLGGFLFTGTHGASIANMWTGCPTNVAEDVTAWKEFGTIDKAKVPDVWSPQYRLKSITPLDTPFAKIKLYQQNGSLYYDNNPGFDFETNPTYTVVVEVIKNAPTPDEGTCVVTITNVNEAPRITNLPNPTSIKENTVFGADTDIYTLTGTDPDAGDAIKYTISEVKPTSGTAKFKIGPTATGTKVQVVSGATFDHETTDHYNLTIKAEDTGTPKLSDTNILKVDIVDVNEAPFFPQSAAGNNPGGKVTVEEESAVGSVLTINHDFGSFIQAKDVDKGDTLTYFLDGAQNGFFEARNDAGICNIYVKTRIDSETNVINRVFNLKVFARDSKDLISTNFYSLRVTIKNINDNMPGCDPTSYSATVAENTAVATTILTVTCTDADGALDRYDIKGDVNAPKYFEIDINGALKVKDLPDLETSSTINFTGYAVQGTPSTSASVSISITITGKNDNKPQFGSTFYNMETVCDYYPVPYPLITVGKTSATDKDITTSVLTYAWVGNDAVGTYTILKTEGRIIPARQLKAASECDQRWLYYVRASDNELTPTFSDHVPVRIDSFKAAPYLVDFHVGESTSYFTDARITRFLSACSAGCNGCLCRLYRISARSGSSTTLTIYALTDSSTELFSNVNQPKNYVAKTTMITTFDPNTKATSGLRLYDEFTITGLEETIPDPAFHETIGGQIVISLLCILATAAIIGGAVKCARVQQAKKSGKGQFEEKRKLQPKKKKTPVKRVDAETGYNGFNFKY